MNPIKDYNKATPFGERKRLEAGGYIIKITSVKNDAEAQRLVYLFDIAEGPKAGYFKDEKEEFRHRFYAYYTPKALGFFKSFIKAIDDTNGTNYDATVETTGLDETQLIGKTVGAVIGYQEYKATDGYIKQRPDVTLYTTAERIRANDFEVPPLKKVQDDTPDLEAIPEGFTALSDDAIPF